MSDTTPINPVATSPPSYTESEAQPKPASVTTDAKLQGSPGLKHDSPPPPYYPPQDPQGPGYQRFDHVIDRQVEVVAVIELGPKSCHLQCPSCGNFVYTELLYRAGALTFLASFLCFLFCILCTCLPCCIKHCLDVDHYCPRCNYHFGTFTRL